MANTSAIGQQAAHSTYSYHLLTAQKSYTKKPISPPKKYWKITEKKVRRMSYSQKNQKEPQI